jgi:hypothetical protein
VNFLLVSPLRLTRWICQAAALVLGLLAAICWYKASTAKVTDKDDKQFYRGIEFRYPDKDGNQIQVLGTATKQSKLNKVAAILTGFAGLFQVAVFIIPSD